MMARRGALLLAMMLAAPSIGMAESRFLTPKVVSHIQAATAACAGYIADGQDLKGLKSSGFDRELSDWIWDTRMHGVEDGRLSVTVSAESGKCQVELSNFTRSDSKWLNETIAAALVARGFQDGDSGARRRDLTRGDLRVQMIGYSHKRTDELSASVTVSR